jgi:hypothetical protein
MFLFYSNNFTPRIFQTDYATYWFMTYHALHNPDDKNFHVKVFFHNSKEENDKYISTTNWKYHGNHLTIKLKDNFREIFCESDGLSTTGFKNVLLEDIINPDCFTTEIGIRNGYL